MKTVNVGDKVTISGKRWPDTLRGKTATVLVIEGEGVIVQLEGAVSEFGKYWRHVSDLEPVGSGIQVPPAADKFDEEEAPTAPYPYFVIHNQLGFYDGFLGYCGGKNGRDRAKRFLTMAEAQKEVMKGDEIISSFSDEFRHAWADEVAAE